MVGLGQAGRGPRSTHDMAEEGSCSVTMVIPYLTYNEDGELHSYRL